MIMWGRLFKSINDAVVRLSTCFERELEAKLAEDSEFKALWEKHLGDSGVLKAAIDKDDINLLPRLVQAMSKKPDSRKILDFTQPLLTRLYDPIRVFGKLIGCPAISMADVSFQEVLQLDALVANIASSAQSAVAERWSKCEVDWASGILKVRDSTARNSEYNPEGLSLFGVMHEITFALKEGQSWPAYVEAIAYWHNAKSHNWNDDSTLHLQPFNRLCGTRPLIDTPQDVELLNFIRTHPAALLFSPVHQDAMARWSYAARCGSAKETKLAQEYLRLSMMHRRSKGRLKLHHIDRVQLRQAHEDLSIYIRNLFRAIRKSIKVDEVRQVFPDCDFLYFDPEAGACSDKLGEKFRLRALRDVLPEPRAEAVSFIMRHTAMKKSYIYDALKD
jgi:hypothetical protein